MPPWCAGDRLAFMLSDGGQNVNGQPVGFGHVHSHEFYTAFHQPADEMDVARQPVELGDQQRRLVLAAGFERGGLRAVILSAALDLGKLLTMSSPWRCKKTFTACCWASKPSPLRPWRVVETSSRNPTRYQS
jgi:hypothetical protein